MGQAHEDHTCKAHVVAILHIDSAGCQHDGSNIAWDRESLLLQEYFGNSNNYYDVRIVDVAQFVRPELMLHRAHMSATTDGVALLRTTTDYFRGFLGLCSKRCPRVGFCQFARNERPGFEHIRQYSPRERITHHCATMF